MAIESKFAAVKSTTAEGAFLIMRVRPVFSFTHETIVSAVRPPSYSSGLVLPFGNHLRVGKPLTSKRSPRLRSASASTLAMTTPSPAL